MRKKSEAMAEKKSRKTTGKITRSTSVSFWSPVNHKPRGELWVDVFAAHERVLLFYQAIGGEKYTPSGNAWVRSRPSMSDGLL